VFVPVSHFDPSLRQITIKKSFIEEVMGVKCGFRIPGILRKVGVLAPPRKKIEKKI
jgi:hypothetical protein